MAEKTETKKIRVIAGTYNGRENARKVDQRLKDAKIDEFTMHPNGEFITIQAEVEGKEAADALIKKGAAAGFTFVI